MLTHRSLPGCLVTLLVIAALLAGCGNKETGEVQSGPPPSPVLLPSDQAPVQTADQTAGQPAGQQTPRPSVQPTPTLFSPGPLFPPGLDLKGGPIYIPLELLIPNLNVNAPMLGVGLNPKNVMDSPKGPIGDPVWHTAFWYRGSGIPGEPGTATVAGHVNDPLGNPEIFAHLQDLKPGDLIIIRAKSAAIDIRFKVDQVKLYSVAESSDPAVLTQIFGAGPVAGQKPQPAPDGLAYLTLITCAGNIVNGEFDHHTVVYATRSP
jgi:hypothetical protein